MTATYVNVGPSNSVSLDISGADGVCATTSGAGSGSIHAVLNPSLLGMTCAGGTAAGPGEFRSAPQMPATEAVSVTAVNAGGLWVLTVSNGLSPIGAGVFVQGPAATAACLAGTLGSTSWLGLLVFDSVF